MKNEFNICPMCGSKKIEWKDDKKWFCPDCGFDLYCNIAAAVGIVLYDDEGNLLFEVRAKNPRKGFLCLPGGFVDAGESCEAAMVRELKEEIGARLEESELTYLCSFPNTYEYKNIEYKTCDIFFTAKLPSEYKNMQAFVQTLKREESEVVRFEVHKVTSLEEVSSLPLAFVSARNTLKKYIKEKAGQLK